MFGPQFVGDTDELLRLLREKPVVRETLAWLLPEAILSDPGGRESRRQSLQALLQQGDPAVQAVAGKILAAISESDPASSSTEQLLGRIAARLKSGDAPSIQIALNEARLLPVTPPDLMSDVSRTAGTHPSPEIRLAARQALRRLQPGADVGDECCGDERAAVPFEPDRRQSVSKAITDLAQGVNTAVVAAGRLATVEDRFWKQHPEDRASTIRLLDALLQDPEPTLVEAAANALSRLRTDAPKPVFTLEELQPLFKAMEASLTPGEYAVAMRDFHASIEPLSSAMGISAGTESLVPATLVPMLLVGPLHENRRAFEAMADAMRRIDPRLPVPSLNP